MINRMLKKTPMILITVFAILLLAVMVRLLTGPSSKAATAGPAWVENNIQVLQATLAVSTNPTEEAFIQGKLNQLRQIQANSLQAQQNAPEKPADACALQPTQLPEPEQISGIEQFPAEWFEQFGSFFNSRWQGEINGQWVVVLAGFSAEAAQQGLVWVLVQDTDDRGEYPSPQMSGALQIQSAEGSRLTLVDASGAQLIFDVAARAYLSRLDEVLPTQSPLPTHTPTPALCP